MTLVLLLLQRIHTKAQIFSNILLTLYPENRPLDHFCFEHEASAVVSCLLLSNRPHTPKGAGPSQGESLADVAYTIIHYSRPLQSMRRSTSLNTGPKQGVPLRLFFSFF